MKLLIKSNSLTGLSRLFLLTFSFATIFVVDSVCEIAIWHLYIYLGLILIDFLDTKSITLYSVWILSFIYIIISEMVLYAGDSRLDILAARLLISANNIVLLGYVSNIRLMQEKSRGITSYIFRSNKKIRAFKSGLISLSLLLLFYVYHYLPSALHAANYGRSVSTGVSDTSIPFGSIISPIGLVLPAIIAYYFIFVVRKYKFVAFLFSLPIFIILFINGTRFPLLFSFIGFLSISGYLKFYNVNFRQVIQSVILIALFLISVNFMQSFRTHGISSMNYQDLVVSDVKQNSFFKKMVYAMSPQGVFDMTRLNIDYFHSHSHTLGVSTGFILYFWIPRAVWPDKPTMLGHWLIRKYRGGFAAGHSSSFGFTGALYADFGVASLFFVFIMGIILKRLENFRTKIFQGPPSYKRVIASMLVPYIFFFVRSPLTSSMTLIGIFVFYKLFQHLIFRTSVVGKQWN